MFDEPTFLEFERISNQATSLELEQMELGRICRQRRLRLTRIGLAATVLTVCLSTAALAGVHAGLLIPIGIFLLLVSIVCVVINGIKGYADREVNHSSAARELASLRESCEFVSAEHESGELRRSEFRTQLTHYANRFSALSRSLEHPFR